MVFDSRSKYEIESDSYGRVENEEDGEVEDEGMIVKNTDAMTIPIKTKTSRCSRSM